jgi:16S rRNA (uracil1498-N3)-methyltransferase
VLRAEPGQLYELSDGQAVWLARTERVRRDAVDFSLVEPLPARQSRLHATLLLAIVKFDRFDWSLEKATELGVAEIVPLAAARSEKALVAAAAKRAGRWQKILLESAQQARRVRRPVLHPATRPAAAFRTAGAQSRSFGTALLLLSERAEAMRLRKYLEGNESTSAALAIGPEGGWTDDEFAAARAAGFAEVSLGGNILRTETAAVAALAMLDYALGD